MTTRRTRVGRAWRWSLLALVVVLAAPATAAAQRAVYVSNTAGSVSTFTINANGSLSVLGGPVSTGGTLTEGLAMTPDAENLYVANFTTNNVSGFNIAANGALSAVSGSPFGTGFSVPLGVAPDPDGGHLFAWNHNSAASAIAVSTINGNGTLTNITGSPFAVPAGRINPFAGSVAPDGDHLYVPNEDNSPASAPETVSAYTVAANGAAAPIQTVASGGLAVQGNTFGSTITPDGNFLYTSNPDDGANGSISGFSVGANGMLTVLPGLQSLNASPGNHPLNMAVSPDGAHLYVATRASNTVNAYNIAASGALSPIAGQPFATDGTNGKALAITPDGQHLYVSNNGSGNITGFNVAASGALTLIPGSPYGAGLTPDLESIATTPNQPATAAFSPTTLRPAGQASSFDATSSSDSDGTIAQYDWDFGDGTTLPNGGPTPQHTYNQPGTYTVQLTVTDNENCSTTRIFTGKATLCNGDAGASISQQVTIQQAQAQAQCVVPNVVGKKKKKAKKAIVAANCTVGTTKKKRSSKVKKKKVIKQKPPAGTVLPAGSPVDLKVSKGKG